MKTLILFLLFAGVSFAQVGEAQSVEQSVVIGVANATGYPELELYPENNQYILSYINEEYKIINDFSSLSFTATDEELNRLYLLIKQQFNNKEEKKLILGNDVIYLITSKNRVTVMATHNNGSTTWFYIYPNELDKLFGKA